MPRSIARVSCAALSLVALTALPLAAQVPPPASLLCTDSGGGTAELSWTNPATYDEINVYVDGVLETTLAGTASSYLTDPLPLPAAPEICLEGVVGPEVSPQSCCDVVLNPLCPIPVEVLTQSTDSTTITPGNSIHCGPMGTDFHVDNSYWRSYSLSVDREITGVEFGVEIANPGTGSISQPIVVRLYDDPNGGSPAPTADLILLREVSFEIEQATQEVLCIGINPAETISAGTDVVVELFTPSGVAALHEFFVGSNALGQSGPSYLSAAGCGTPEPVDTATLGFPGMHIVLNLLHGNASPPEICDNGIDDDLDGLTDCADPDCSGDPSCGAGGQFVRGDANADGAFDISDAVFSLAALFIPMSPPPDCSDSADANDDGAFDVSDAVYSLAALFIPMSPPPPPPNPGCGADPTADALDCGAFGPCP